MKSLWNQTDADACEGDAVDLRAYTSRLLGSNSDLVLHGGGNTSVKASCKDVFGDSVEALYVKGSGWDLRTIQAAGFPPTRLDYLLRLGELESLSDSEMMRQLRLALLDPTGPTPSVEAILHALIPHKFVDHTHADAVVTVSNSPNGEAILKQIYGPEVLVLPYIMPGFILARQVAAATAEIDWDGIRGIVLMHHGIFTFHEEAKTSYETMIELVNKAEDYLHSKAPNSQASAQARIDSEELRKLSNLRKEAGQLFGGPVLLRLDDSPLAAGFASLANGGELIQRGPLTPDHTIHAKAFGAVFGDDPCVGLAEFDQQYRQYFKEHSNAQHKMLDTMPRYGAWCDRGMVYLAANLKRLQIVADVSAHTLKAIQQAEVLGGWQTLPRSELFEVEYWELEQAKLKAGNKRAEFEGQVALVTGAASGIGRATVEALVARGAVVVALDIADMSEVFGDQPLVLAVHCDVTNKSDLDKALSEAVMQFGGIDLLVSNAGNFPASASIAELDDDNWQASLELNLSAHMKLLRACSQFLACGFNPAVVFVGSKNVPAPGPGASAYSVAKAGLQQLARVAALELGGQGVRINSVHPNAVYDTELWTEEILQSRAAHYGLSVADYKQSNVMRTEIHSSDVAATILALLGAGFSKTTGAQVAVDGGNERVI